MLYNLDLDADFGDDWYGRSVQPLRLRDLPDGVPDLLARRLPLHGARLHAAAKVPAQVQDAAGHQRATQHEEIRQGEKNNKLSTFDTCSQIKKEVGTI